MSKQNNNYYVYGLIDPRELDNGRTPTRIDRLGATFYVGKGTEDRLNFHLRETRKFLAEVADSLDDVLMSDKIAYIKEILDAGVELESYKFVGGIQNESDAFRVETFAIDAVNAIRRTMGRRLLTNAVSGHGVGIEELNNYNERLNAQALATSFNADHASILVKCSDADMARFDDQPADAATADAVLAQLPEDLREHVVVMEQVAEDGIRRGWDVALPWTKEEALERAQKYWPIGQEHIQQWLRSPETMPKYLLAGVKSLTQDGNKTVIRYVWEIDTEGKWQYHDGRWGIPVKELLPEHPYRNKYLVNAETGEQVLKDHAAGIRIARF